MGRMRKKGAIEIQFNWMFVLVAGAIILSFFVVFVLQQREASEQKLSASLIKDLETKITSARVSGGSAAELNLHDLEIFFSCEDYRLKGVSESINYRAIFTPDRVKGRTMLLWSMPWSIPFKVTNLLFITSPDAKYVILDTNTNSLLTNDVYERMANKFLNVDLVDENSVDTIDISSGYKIKIVCFDCDNNIQNLDLSRFYNFADPDVRAVSITSSPPYNVNFYVMDQESLVSEGTSPFFGTDSDSEATMYAAIFADSKDTYDCNMNKALNTFSIVAQVYKNRMLKLQQNPNLAPEYCRDYYFQPDSIIDEMIVTASLGYSPSVRDTLTTNALSLDSYQDNYIRRQSCPLVY